MRHNALITIISNERSGRREFNISLASHAQPHQIKLISRKAVRGMRRDLTEEAEQFAINIIRLSAPTTVNIIEHPADPLWRYEFHLIPPVPRLYIRRPDQKLSKIHKLFRWLGAERAKIVPVNITPDPGRKRGRGRPSALSKLQLPPSAAPLYVKDGVAYFTPEEMRRAGIKLNQK